MSNKINNAKNGSSPSKNGAINNHDEPYESPYLRQPKKFNFWRGIYNKDKNYILGRTPRNWGSLLIFYTIFYIILAALFAICMQGLFWSLSDTEPKWQLDESRIGSNPGLGFRPISENINDGSLIWYKSTDKKQTDKWEENINKFLQPYVNGNYEHQVICDFDNPPAAGKACSMDVTKFGPCNPKNGYGYNSSAPCVFLKLNRIFNWVPDFHNQIVSLPGDMPDDLKLYIAEQKQSARNQIWVSCRGEHSADRESLGPIQFYPSRGFPGYFYPYTNVQGYQSPLIAVQFERPIQNRIINIECRAWAKNLHYDGSYRDRQGSVHFELMVD